jgi:thiol-disulfide isomerase/thioredoxin
MTLAALALAAFMASDEASQRAEDVQKLRANELNAIWAEYLKEKQGGGPVRWADLTRRLLALADSDPSDRVGFEALVWVAVQEGPDHPQFARAMDLLTLRHAGSWRSRQLCGRLLSPRYYGTASAHLERMMSRVAEENEDKDTRAAASFGLAQYLKNKAELARRLKDHSSEELVKRVKALWGVGYVEVLVKADPDELLKRGSEMFGRSVRQYRDFAETHVTLGMQSPEIRGEDIEGDMMRLTDFRGTVVVLSFWGFGCPPCRFTFPQERELVRRNAGKPFALLGVNNDADRSSVRGLMKKENITWRSWWDGGDSGNPIAGAWTVRAWPTGYVIDHLGVVRYQDLEGDALDLATDILLSEAMHEGGESRTGANPEGSPR